MKPTEALVEIPRGDSIHGWVYIASDADGRALYVGQSVRPRERLRQHRNAAWWPQVDAQTARDVEAVLIDQHQPPNNVMHTARYLPPNRRSLSPVIVARREVDRLRELLATAEANLAHALAAEQTPA